MAQPLLSRELVAPRVERRAALHLAHHAREVGLVRVSVGLGWGWGEG